METFRKNTFTKQGFINKLQILIQMFEENPTMECSMAIDKVEDYLVEKYDMTEDELEQIEIEVLQHKEEN